MKKIVFILVIFLLLFNGIGAFYGGLSLINDPTGKTLQLPASYLQNIPFNSFLIPGIILITVNGLLSFLTIGIAILNKNRSYLFIIIQGILLSGWIIVQLFLVKDFYPPLHGTLLSIGILLILCGLFLRKKLNQ